MYDANILDLKLYSVGYVDLQSTPGLFTRKMRSAIGKRDKRGKLYFAFTNLHYYSISGSYLMASLTSVISVRIHFFDFKASYSSNHSLGELDPWLLACAGAGLRLWRPHVATWG